MHLNHQAIFTKYPSPSSTSILENFDFRHTSFPNASLLQPEEVLVQNLFLGIHASMRVWISGIQSYKSGLKIGDTMHGSSVALILHSRSAKYKAGDMVVGMFAWETYSIGHSSNIYYPVDKAYPYPQHFLSALGNSGLTAYIGLTAIGQVRKGNTVVVSAAAGGVGQMAVGLAKIWGCKVVGLAGSEEKCKFVKEFLGADECINYQKEDLKSRLIECCREGIDVFFDNVGGNTLDTVLTLINEHARIVVCGNVSQYSRLNEKKLVDGVKNLPMLIVKQAKMEGFVYFKHVEKIPKAVEEIKRYISDGRLKFKEVVFEGLREAPKALQMVFDRRNIGKVIVKMEDPKDLIKSKI